VPWRILPEEQFSVDRATIRTRVYLAVSAAVFVTALLSAQTPAAAVEGVAVDVTGASVVGATITVRDVDTNRVSTITTGESGSFRFASLPVGVYQLRASYPGFVDYALDNLALTVGSTVHLTVALTPAGIAEAVSVSAQPSPLDVRQTAVTTTVDNERIEELPVQSRDYLHFVLLAPGVVGSVPNATAQGAASAALPDSGFSFAGLRPRSNNLTIDGLDNNDRYSGTSRTELSLETVREFQVITSGYSAENGGASGGAINVATKSGSNTIHGDVFLFAGSGLFDAPPPFEETLGATPSLTRFRAGFAIGGPLKTDRTFYYAAVEREHTRSEAASDIDPPVAAAVNRVLAKPQFAGAATRAVTVGLFPTGLDETEWSGKLNHQWSPRQSVTIRAAGVDRTETADAFNAGGLNDVSSRGSSSTGDTALAGTWTSVIGSTVTNDMRAQFADRRVDLSTTDTQGPGLLIAGLAELGRPYAGNDTHSQRYVEFGDTLAWSRRAHVIKAGFDGIHLDLTGTRTDGAGGIYQFSSLNAFVGERPDAFRQTFDSNAVALSTTHVGVFAQDQWTPASRVSIDAGVRFDADSWPATLNITDRQWSPRLGVAWTPAPKWIVRGGIGRFADRLVLAALEPALTLDGRHGFEQILDAGDASSILRSTNGGALPAPLPGVAPSIYTTQAGAWRPASRQASVGVERELTPYLTASLSYLAVGGEQLTRTVNVNLPQPVLDNGRFVFGPSRLNLNFNDIFQLQPTASSTYRGVTATLNRRLANELEWSASYTWSHATDTASDFDEQPQNPYDLGAESADSRYDQRHRLVVSALFDLPIGDEEDQQSSEPPGFWTHVFSNVEMAPIFTAASGQPVNPITGADDARTHAFPLTARPVGSARNSLRLPSSATLDLRVLKFFNVKPHGKLDIVVEAFNVLNRTNVAQLNAVYGPQAAPVATFGHPLDAAPARRIQFSIDFEY
jgi:outer membrane receptor protein involved in Fe transport